MKRVCLLTGASGVFGREFMRIHANDYAFVALYRLNLPLIASQQVRMIDPLAPADPTMDDGLVFTIACDLRIAGESQRVLDLAFARFGRIDVVIHAAVFAVWAPLIGSGRAVATAEEQFRVNTLIPLDLSTALVQRHWRDDAPANLAANRNFVFLSSLAASRVFPGRGQSVYAASKAALSVLSQHMASEFAAVNVRANAVEPDSFPSLVAVSSVVHAVRLLDQSSLTGQVVPVRAAG